MRTINQQVQVYTYAELSDTAKDRVRQWLDPFEFEAECVTDDFKTIAEMLGFYDITPRWSGFWSQGDGASFTGRYSYAKGAPAKVRGYAPMDTELHAIADALQTVQRRNFYRLCARLSDGAGSNHYAHENTVHIEVADCENDYRDLRGDDDVIVELCRDLMRWFYKALERGYDACNADDAVSETCEANGYEFLEDGGTYHA